MPKVLRLHQLGMNVDGWQQTNQLTASEIKDMQDGAGAKATKVSTSIPTPFARMHLFETAFDFVTRETNQYPNSIYHKMVSHFWDLWEILFNYELYMQGEQKIRVRRWRRDTEIKSMLQNPGSRLLGKTLQLFAASDKRFKDFNDLYFFYFEYEDKSGERRQELLGGTSPFTALFVSPQVSPLPLERLQSKGHYFDNNFVPLEERDEAFKAFVYELFSANESLSTSYPTIYKSLDQKKLSMIAMDGVVKLDKYVSMTDDEGNPISLGLAPFLILSNEQEGEIKSDLFIKPTREISERLPILLKPKLKLTGQVKYFKNFAWKDITGDEVPYMDNKPLDERTLPGKGVRYPYLTINDFLEDTLVQLPYEVNQERFHCGVVKFQPGTDKTFSFLLPITKLYFDYFNEKDLAEHLQFHIDLNHVKVTLKIPIVNGEVITYERSYYQNPQNPKDKDEIEIPEKGRIIEALIGIGVFPFYKFIDQPQSNDFYKVMVVDEDMAPEMRNKRYDLKFFVDNQLLSETGGNKRVTGIERSVKSEITVGSKYYELNGTHFDFAEVHCPGRYNGKGLFVPKFQEIAKGTKSFTFAIDFGTTNTYVSYADSDLPNEEPKTFAITAKDLQLVMLNSPFKDPALTDYQNYSKGFGVKMQNTDALAKRELMPSIISDGGSPYQFPIRTATFEDPSFRNNTPSVFGNINIGFTINTEATFNYGEYYHTNLKWNTENEVGQRRVEVFFKELMLLIKNKVALNRGILENTKIVWFAPLSFNSFSKNLFQRDWDSVFQKVFNTEKHTISMTESVAPYHYLRMKGDVTPNKEEGLVNIDIGGGTTDVLLYMNQKAAYSFSYKFAGDDIWGDGYATIRAGRDNGLMRYGRDKIRAMPHSDEQRELTHYLTVAEKNLGFGSTDIVSLMFNYDDSFSYSKLLHQAPALRVIFYLHFGMILYQLGQTLKSANISIPRYICFSGRGSLYIKILSAGPNLSAIEKYAKAILKEVTQEEAPSNFKIILVNNPKQTTANGGVLAVNSSESFEQDEIPIIRPLGDGKDVAIVDGTFINNINKEVISDILSNAKTCLDLLLKNKKIVPLMKELGVEFDGELIIPFLEAQLSDSFTIGFEQIEKQIKEQELLPETLFFLPFKQALYALSKELYPINN